MENLLSRNSPRELTTPIPSKEDMSEIYQAALRAPDHAWLRPSRFIQVTGKGLSVASMPRAVNKVEERRVQHKWTLYC